MGSKRLSGLGSVFSSIHGNTDGKKEFRYRMPGRIPLKGDWNSDTNRIMRD